MADPIGHSLDTDYVHFPGGEHFDVYEWTAREFKGFFQILNYPFAGLDEALSWFGLEGPNIRIHGLSKFMILELIASVLCIFIFLPLALNVRRHGYAKGWVANLFEAMAVFIKDEIAVPAIGDHDAHRFVPYLWTTFFFILFCNLLGMIPIVGGSPTGVLGTTVGLALVAFFTIHGSGVATLGAGGYAKAFVPHVPVFLYPLMFVIELIGHIIKPTILAIRLFVNMLAGHTVLYVILGFIVAVGPGLLYFMVTPASLLGVVLLSLLELFVAFLQAYVFTFLTALFIGASVHPHH